MKDEGILEGDYILVQRTEVAQNGDRVVALLPDGSTTLKRFFREEDHIRLQPANPEFDPSSSSSARCRESSRASSAGTESRPHLNGCRA